MNKQDEVQYRSDKLERDLMNALARADRAAADDDPIYSRSDLEHDIRMTRQHLLSAVRNFSDLQRAIGTDKQEAS